jgi:glucose-6-phosphate isomerase
VEKTRTARVGDDELAAINLLSMMGLRDQQTIDHDLSGAVMHATSEAPVQIEHFHESIHTGFIGIGGSDTLAVAAKMPP